MLQKKEQDKTSEEKLCEVEISNLPDKHFKVMIIKILRQLRRRMDEHSEKLGKRKYKEEPNRAEEYNN